MNGADKKKSFSLLKRPGCRFGHHRMTKHSDVLNPVHPKDGTLRFGHTNHEIRHRREGDLFFDEAAALFFR